MSNIILALIPTGKKKVENIIVANEGFTQEGFDLVQIKSGIYCSPGMFYDSVSGLFYQDESLTVIFPEDNNSLIEEKEKESS